MLNLFLVLTCFSETIEAEVQVPDFPYIPIVVEETWQIPYALEIQDIAIDWGTGYLIIRSNADGKLFLANPGNCEYQGEIALPAGSDGFGVAASQGMYYINSSTSPMIFYSDGSDTWSEFPNPAATGGAGMDFNDNMFPDLCEAAASSPYQFYYITPDGSSYDTYGLPGVNGEISGFMGHLIATLDFPPSGLIITTRFGHEFFFYHNAGATYTQYGQEPCPVPVSESLGLAWGINGYVYWSYKGQDDEYYISRLMIPVFGGIEDDPAAETYQTGHISTAANPSTGSASLAVNINDPAQILLEVFDLSGRLMEVLHNGQLASGESTFGFSGPPGIYTAYLRYSEQVETFRFVLLR
ncbi:MAG: T9SS type A sorting domain-containing protein [Candidatus Aegiribacteria sp.]|nr:T9SS type A sorting domain-containing protein [Candidatus Aegiribacteria sp.]